MQKSAAYEWPEAPPLLSRGDEVELVARVLARINLYPWQNRVLGKACAVDAAERWLATHVTIICPRRNGKTYLVLARVLAECLLWSDPDDPAVVLYTAHLGDTAREVFKSFLAILYRSPQLQALVAVGGVTHGKGDESVTFTNGARFVIRARTNAGGRGLECTTLIIDEALEAKSEHMAALTPLLAKAEAQGRGQLWMLSSAGHGKSDVLRAARDRGREGGDPTLVYVEFTVPRDADPMDPAVRAAANPSVGTPTLSDSYLRSQILLLGLEDGGREHLGWWTDQQSVPFLPHGSWSQCSADPPPLPARPRVSFGLELGEHGTAAVLVAAVDLGEGSCWVETIARWEDPNGLDPAAVAADILAEVKLKRPVIVAGDGYTSATLLAHLKAKGVKVDQLNFTGVRDASQSLLAGVTGLRIRHPEDPQTDPELVNAGKAPTGDGLERLSRKASTGPSTAAFATAAAVHHILGPLPGKPAIHAG